MTAAEISSEGLVEAPKRVQRKRAKGWRMPENTVCVCRPGPFGNPFPTSAAIHAGLTEQQSARRFVVQCFSEWISNGRMWVEWDAPRQDRDRAELLRRIPELRGKNLACWCPPDQPCHADVLLRLANGALAGAAG